MHMFKIKEVYVAEQLKNFSKFDCLKILAIGVYLHSKF